MIIFGWWGKRSLFGFKWGRIIFAILAIWLLLYSFWLGRKDLPSGEYRHQREMLQAAFWAKENLASTSKVGSFNAGIIGYFSGLIVVNLDGVVNTNAYRAIQERSLGNYIREEKISYLVDYDPFMLNWYRPFLGNNWDNIYLTRTYVIDEPGIDWEKSMIVFYRLEFKEP